SACVALMLGLLLTVPTPAVAQYEDDSEEIAPPPPPRPEPSERVVQYDLSGPRIGATFFPSGPFCSHFAAHTENQAAPGRRGPWFLVEKVFLFGGMEANTII